MQRRKETTIVSNNRTARRIFIGLIGGTVILLGVVTLVTPGPAFIIIPAGLAILALEFTWARRTLKRLRTTAVAQMGGEAKFERRLDRYHRLASRGARDPRSLVRWWSLGKLKVIDLLRRDHDGPAAHGDDVSVAPEPVMQRDPAAEASTLSSASPATPSRGSGGRPGDPARATCETVPRPLASGSGQGSVAGPRHISPGAKPSSC